MLGKIARRYACIVHQNIDVPEVRSGFIHRLRNLRQVGHIHLQRQYTPSQSANLSRKPPVRIEHSQT